MATNDFTAMTAAAQRRGFFWFAGRAVLGLSIMLVVTGLAAIIAQASIDDLPDELAIGAPASPLIGGGAVPDPALAPPPR